MGTLLDLASLVTIPSGYKVGTVYSVVPTDGAGDLSFTRSNDTATRVGPNGLIEKVRTNLILESQALATTWSVFAPSGGGTIVRTNNYATAPDGTMTATRIVNTGSSANQWVYQDFSPKPSTFSIYAKRTGATNQTFRLFGNNGAVATGNLTATDTWQRFSFTIVADTAKPMGIAADISGNTYDILFWGAQFEDTDFGPTDYIPTTTTAVSVGPVANLPRLDYLNSTCPNLLLEPQRTNLVTNSENLSGAGWSSQGSTITSNATTSPDGYSNADAIVETATTNEHNRITGGTLTATSHTASVFLKKFNQTWCALYLYNGTAGIRHWINLDTLTAGTSANIGAGITAPLTLTNYGNGWVRASMTWTPDATGWSFYIACARSNGGATNYAGDGTSGLYAWGAQIEVGAYATSYIPTLGAASTRGVDSCSKTGISSLIGQTEGTIFVDINYTNTNNTADATPFRIIGSGSAQMYVEINTNETFEAVVVNSAGTLIFNSTSTAQIAGRKKIAIAYKGSDFAYYINGTQIGVQTSGAFASASLDSLNLGMYSSGVQVLADSVNEAILFPTRLSNAEIAQLTTI